jgi:GNAT superfamily N-acetyltransferase
VVAVPEIRIATLDDLPTIETTLGLAFEDDPVWRWVLGRRNKPATRMGAVLGAFARMHLDASTVFMTTDGGAVAIWGRPGHWRVPPVAFLRHGGWPLTKAGPLPFARFLMLGETERRHPREEHWYLEVLGTRPDRQGEGLGSALIHHVLDGPDAAGLPAYLESSKEANLAFYGRHGFAVKGDTIDMPRGGPTIWPMWREAR